MHPVVMASPPRIHGESLPSAYDLRLLDRVSPIRDQGVFGTCWAFAACASLESVLLPHESRDFSEDHMVLRSGFDHGGDPYMAGGNYEMATAYLTRWGGPVYEADDGYGDGVSPSGLTPRKRVQQVLSVGGTVNGGGTAAIKAAVMEHGAVATKMYMPSGYDPAPGIGYRYCGSAYPNHGIAIVGWDDAFAAARFATPPASDGAWLVRNSYGRGWGDEGYFWISYHDAWCGTAAVDNVVYSGVGTTSAYHGIYYHDPLGQVDAFGYGTDTAWGANAFTARKTQVITAAGFFTHVPGTTYTVYAGRTLSDLRARGTGTVATPGFHTARLATPLGVTLGSRFVVAVRMTSPGFTYPISCELRIPGYTSAASAQRGQSYVSQRGTSWTDLTDAEPTANVCLKAYATNDTTAPSTAAAAASVGRYRTVALQFRVNDAAPSCGKASVRIQIRKDGRTVKSIAAGTRSVNYVATYKYKAGLPRGTYSWRVQATDLAGNKATKLGSAKLVIK
jgi:C1A family cysteine protease